MVSLGYARFTILQRSGQRALKYGGSVQKYPPDAKSATFLASTIAGGHGDRTARKITYEAISQANMGPAQHDIATRASIVSLKSVGGKTTLEIHGLTGIPIRTINEIYARAIKRGFDPHSLPLKITDEFLKDGARLGRPTKQTEETRQILELKVRFDRYGREKTAADLAGELASEGIEISATTVHRVLKKAGFRKTKPTRKPGLTQKMKDDRLRWCLEHKDWTLDDWKNVVWSDETSVVLNHRRGGYRIWRQADERFVKSCIRERWKGHSEFMVWGCFTYEQKGPLHIWLPETKYEKEQAAKEINKWNEELEPKMKEQWELTTGMRRLGLRNKPGKQPQWRWTKENGKLVRQGDKGGIDWYRYQLKILHAKLFPFARRCILAGRPNTVVQEDKAPCHNHHFQQHIYDLANIKRLLWCGNSPDLNAIEPTWAYLKRETTKKGAPKKPKGCNDCVVKGVG